MSAGRKNPADKYRQKACCIQIRGVSMSGVKHIIQRIREGRLKQLIGELLWMYAYVRRYWFLIGVYILLGASGSVLSLGTSVVSRDLVDAVTGVNSMEIVRVAATYVGVGVSQIFINAVKSRMSLKVRLKVTNEIRADIYDRYSGPTGSRWPNTDRETCYTG